MRHDGLLERVEPPERAVCHRDALCQPSRKAAHEVADARGHEDVVRARWVALRVHDLVVDARDVEDAVWKLADGEDEALELAAQGVGVVDVVLAPVGVKGLLWVARHERRERPHVLEDDVREHRVHSLDGLVLEDLAVHGAQRFKHGIQGHHLLLS